MITRASCTSDIEATLKIRADPRVFPAIDYAFCVAINRIKLIPCSDTCLVQSEELLVIRANRKQARELPRRPV